MTTVNTTLQSDEIRAALAGFWNNALAIERIRNGFAVAMPQTGADGWQLVIELTEPTPGMVRVSDAGRTLGGLAAQGQNLESGSVSAHTESILRQSHMERAGTELFRWLPLPLDPVEVHVFVEALAAISHLWVLHEPAVRTQDIADLTLRRVFSDRHVVPRQGATLAGRTEKSVRVDYLVESSHPVAFEILRRRGRLLPVMEQWGYRWQDLQKVNPALMPVMLYDPASQEIDEGSRAIGEEVCSLFCAYDETDRIHSVMEKALAA